MRCKDVFLRETVHGDFPDVVDSTPDIPATPATKAMDRREIAVNGFVVLVYDRLDRH